jgi:Bacterial Ig domain/Divergent InlB B-repeat domain/Right handed beta helix region
MRLDHPVDREQLPYWALLSFTSRFAKLANPAHDLMEGSVKAFRTLVFFVRLLIIPLLFSTAFATTRYVAQSAGTFSGGTACNGQTTITPATFNSTTLAAGDITWVCGAITFSSAGTNVIVPNNGGSSGNPVVINFDTGSSIKGPSCGTYSTLPTGGCIVINNQWTTVNGMGVGIIQNTLQGTSGATCPGGTCSLENPTAGVFIAASNVVVENVTIADMYDRTPCGSSTEENDQFGIMITGGASNVTIKGNTVHDGENLIVDVGSSGTISGTVITQNTLYHSSAAIVIAEGNGAGIASGFTISFNNIYDNYYWWDTGDGDHLNGMHPFAAASGTALNNFSVHDNYVHGNFGGSTCGGGGSHTTAMIFFETTGGGTGSGNIFFNNLIVTGNDDDPSNGLLNLGDSNDSGMQVYNNTLVGANDGSGVAVQVAGTFTMKNNISSGLTYGLYANGAGGSQITAANNNTYYEASTGWYLGGSVYSSLSAWQSACSCDAASITTNPNLAANYTLNSGSPAIGIGANLTSLSITALDTGAPLNSANGASYSCTGGCVARPSSGNWDLGAFPSGSGSTYSITVTASGLGSVSSSPSGISCPSSCSASYSSGTVVTLTESPSSGQTFLGWSGDGCSGTATTCNVTMNAAESVTASFSSGGTQYYISLATNSPAGSDSNNCTSASTPCLTVAHVETLAGTGATLNFAPGPSSTQAIYRLTTGTSGSYTSAGGQIHAKANQVFTGPACTPTSAQCLAVLSGSVQLTSGQILGPDGDGNYYATGFTQHGNNAGYSCDTLGGVGGGGWPGCNNAEDLYVNGTPYQSLSLGSEATLAAGSWWFDYATDTIYLPSTLTPTFVGANTVELGVLNSVFYPATPPNGVTVENLTVEEFASSIENGAIDITYGNTATSTAGINWIIQNNYVTLNHGTGIRPGFGAQVLNNVATNNGNLGIGGGLPGGATLIFSGLLIQGNTITLNNYAHVTPGFGAGGIKFGNTEGAIVRGNIVENNIGNGIHFDVNSLNPLIDGNTVEGNVDADYASGSGYGVLCEISENGCTARNNYIQFQGIGGAVGLQSSTSVAMQAYCNVIEQTSGSNYVWSITAGSRGNNTVQPNLGAYIRSLANYFHHNTIIWDAGTTGPVGFNLTDTANQANFFSVNTPPDFNTYHGPSTSVTQFVYDNNGSGSNTLKNFTNYQAAGADVHGTFDTINTSGFPAVSITSPADQTQVTPASSVTVSASASDASGISQVQFYVDWTLASTVSSSPYNFTWKAFNGSHVIAAMATSNAGVKSCWAITVIAPPSPAPASGVSATISQITSLDNTDTSLAEK